MIVLDTNILSELMRKRPEKKVMEWMAKQPQQSLFTTTITVAEILCGIKLLPEGKRQAALLSASKEMLMCEFAGKILSFDMEAAEEYASIAVSRRRRGRPISHFDAQIAAITRSRGASIATRNVDDFDFCNIHIVNPWQS